MKKINAMEKKISLKIKWDKKVHVYISNRVCQHLIYIKKRMKRKVK